MPIYRFPINGIRHHDFMGRLDELCELAQGSVCLSALNITIRRNVMQAIRNMEPAWEKICGRKFALTSRTITQPNGGTREVPCYQLFTSLRSSTTRLAPNWCCAGRNWRRESQIWRKSLIKIGMKILNESHY